MRLLPDHLRDGRFDARIVNAGNSRTAFARPLCWLGRFAAVYSCTLADGSRRAIRFFLGSAETEFARRYRELKSHFEYHDAAFMLDFAFHERGIALDEEENAVRPLVEMDFAEGGELLDLIARLSDSRDREGLEQVAARWVLLCKQMHAANVAHGDLNPHNAMIANDGRLVLIDYDTMYVPSLRDEPPRQDGNSHYQHRRAGDFDPSRRGPYGRHMDDFSMLLVYVALLAPAEQPQLIRRFANRPGDSSPGGKVLLFRDVDLADPGRSEVFWTIAKACRGSNTRSVLELFAERCKSDDSDSICFLDVV